MEYAQESSAVHDARSFPLWLWGLFLVGIPFYVFADGMPQPAYLLVPILVFAIVLRRAEVVITSPSPGQGGLLLNLGMFVLYTCLVAVVWYVFQGDYSMLAYPAYYVFNYSLFWLVLALKSEFGDRFDTFTASAITLSIALQVILIPIVGTRELLRQPLFFKNPNQLGYYALLAATALLLFRERAKLSITWLAVGLFGALTLGVISLSRSALISMVLLILLIFRRRLKMIVLGMVLVTLIVSFAWTQLPPLARDRLFMATLEVDDSFAGRGYDRILNHPGYLIFGAGEGAFGRFQSFLAGEIHSSIGTIVFAYGLPGLLLFSRFLVDVMGRCGGSSWLLLLPALAYGLTHQGLRFAMLWVILGVACTPRKPDARNAG